MVCYVNGGARSTFVVNLCRFGMCQEKTKEFQLAGRIDQRNKLYWRFYTHKRVCVRVCVINIVYFVFICLNVRSYKEWHPGARSFVTEMDLLTR